MMDWKDVPKYGKDGRFITEDEFRDAVIDVASDLAVKVSPRVALEAITFGVLLNKKLFEKEDK